MSDEGEVANVREATALDVPKPNRKMTSTGEVRGNIDYTTGYMCGILAHGAMLIFSVSFQG